jgi:hypothetical protein
MCGDLPSYPPVPNTMAWKEAKNGRTKRLSKVTVKQKERMNK